jgi:hypothetical protein
MNFKGGYKLENNLVKVKNGDRLQIFTIFQIGRTTTFLSY